MAIHTMENDVLRVSVADEGAELVSVLDKRSGEERIWQADPAVWNRHAPILFPFVGKVVDGKYRFNGREYPMKTQHGFARDKVFACVRAGEDCVLHELRDTPETLEIYPWPFRLRVKHSLDEAEPSRLRVTWEVENTGTETMLFAIGAHPGFLMPPGTAKEECRIGFPGKESLSYFSANPAGYALPEIVKELPLTDSASPWLDNMPETWIFQNQGIDRVEIRRPDGEPYVALDCPGFPLLAVWAKAEGPYICLEPWYGRTDNAGFTGTLAEKPGEQSLAPGETITYSYAMTFYA